MIVPEVPTLAESGLPGFDFSTWWGLFAPAGTPRPEIERLNHETLKALQLPTLGADGKITATRVQVSKDGVKPPV